jgi:thiosulfate/3-mercaptopyruvate sulfurtransferase
MLTAVVLTMLAPAAPDQKEYARPKLLAEPAALKKEDERKGFVILDARRKAEYLSGHVPGAVWVDPAAWAKAFGKGDGKSDWSGRIGALGVATDSKVVVYDASQSKDAARIWWILRYWGVEDVRLLNGGWAGWKSAGGDVSKDVPEVTATKPELKPQADRLATKDELLKAIEKKSLGQLVDARSEGEHCGETTTAERNGSIPEAKHLEWSDTIDRKTGRFKSAAELAKLFEAAGIDPTKPATTYCQSGGRASVMAFVLELAGGAKAKNYHASWAEWGNDDKTPIIKPKPKAKKKDE